MPIFTVPLPRLLSNLPLVSNNLVDLKPEGWTYSNQSDDYTNDKVGPFWKRYGRLLWQTVCILEKCKYPFQSYPHLAQ